MARHQRGGAGRWWPTLRGFADPAHELGDSLVDCDFIWITDGDPEQVIGFCAVRHTLNAFLRELGRRDAARGTPPALALALDRAAELGIDRTLVTCDVDNEPSRRTIERNGGVYEDRRA